MNEYRVVFLCNNGYEGEIIVFAANRAAAIELFSEMGYDEVIDVQCYRVKGKGHDIKC